MQVTLANLAEATAQQVFNQVAIHLLTQMKPSRKESASGGIGQCRYRHENLKCAAGCLIGDNEYIPDMDNETHPDGTAWDELTVRGVLPKTQHTQFIRKLQEIHDKWHPDLWKHELTELAVKNNLTMPEIIRG